MANLSRVALMVDDPGSGVKSLCNMAAADSPCSVNDSDAKETATLSGTCVVLELNSTYPFVNLQTHDPKTKNLPQ